MGIINHPFESVFNENSRILILGSFPSEKSREEGFFYGNPHNRFWKIIAHIAGTKNPASINEKKHLLLDNRIALSDILQSCRIIGSSDNSISEEKPMDLSPIFKIANIERIYANGTTACRFFRKYYADRNITQLPSTSPANAKYALSDLISAWEKAIKTA